jgi:hypothetical protein
MTDPVNSPDPTPSTPAADPAPAAATPPAASAPASDPAAPAASAPATPAADPAAQAPAAQPNTILKAAEGAEPPVKPVGDFPDDWREKLAGDNEKMLNMLKRFGSPKALAEAYDSAQTKIRSGIKAPTLSENATPEEITEFRKANGIPETPDGYDLSLPNGLVIGEVDKPYVDKFVEKMHGLNATPSVVKAAIEGYYQLAQEADAAVRGLVEQQKSTNDTELKTEWGGDYQRNLNIVSTYLNNHFGEAGEILANAYDAQGLPLGNNATVLRKLLALAHDHDPVGATIPAVGMSGADQLTSEIETLEKRMKTDPTWHKDTKANNRYMELLTAREKIQKRG